VALALAAAAGCAHPGARGAAAPSPSPAPTTPPAPEIQADLPAPDRVAPEPPETTASRAPELPGHPSRLDPSEEITPEELATLPEPVPAGGSRPPTTPGGTRQGDPLSRPSGVESEPQEPSDGLWRVQIYASESRTEAERVGRTAAGLLHAPAAIVREGYLYKVRLGAFDSEQDAQELRDRAIRAGYPGAFRTRSMP